MLAYGSTGVAMRAPSSEGIILSCDLNNGYNAIGARVPKL